MPENNTEPVDRGSLDQPMTEPQRSEIRRLSAEAREPDRSVENLTQAEAVRLIKDLREKAHTE
jgi:hypothetical protein